jgi:hypothetical protein
VVRHAGGLVVVLVQGVIFHLGHVTPESCSQSEKSFPMKREVRFRHFVKPILRSSVSRL